MPPPSIQTSTLTYYTHTHTLITFWGGWWISGGGAGSREEQRTDLRITPMLGLFLSFFSAAPPPPAILCQVGMAIKEEAKILLFGTKGQTPICSTQIQ